jgi:hypothetical protein
MIKHLLPANDTEQAMVHLNLEERYSVYEIDD